jgi:hypothetical protein
MKQLAARHCVRDNNSCASELKPTQPEKKKKHETLTVNVFVAKLIEIRRLEDAKQTPQHHNDL